MGATSVCRTAPKPHPQPRRPAWNPRQKGLRSPPTQAEEIRTRARGFGLVRSIRKGGDNKKNDSYLSTIESRPFRPVAQSALRSGKPSRIETRNERVASSKLQRRTKRNDDEWRDRSDGAAYGTGKQRNADLSHRRPTLESNCERRRKRFAGIATSIGSVTNRARQFDQVSALTTVKRTTGYSRESSSGPRTTVAAVAGRVVGGSGPASRAAERYLG